MQKQNTAYRMNEENVEVLSFWSEIFCPTDDTSICFN